MALAEPRIPVPLRSREEKRQAERVGVVMPVHLPGHDGSTRDLSASGLCFDSSRAYVEGEQVELVIEYLMDGHNYPLRCQAEVVRCEPDGAGFRIGARLLPPPGARTLDVG